MSRFFRLSLPRKKKTNCERLTVFQLKSRLEKLAAMEEWLLSSHKEELQAMSLRHKECVSEKKTIVEKDQRGKSCVSGGSSNKWPPPWAIDICPKEQPLKHASRRSVCQRLWTLIHHFRHCKRKLYIAVALGLLFFDFCLIFTESLVYVRSGGERKSLVVLKVP